jgi:putative transcriptional regulator
MDNINLTGQFLIAMPALSDPFFARTLVFVCEHNENGALGIIVNRPLDLSLADLYERLDLKLEQDGFAKLPVYFGGPVQTDRGFVLHRPAGHWQSSLAVSSTIGLTSSRDILSSIAQLGEPAEVLVSLGYAGWEAGQLENELTENAWLTVDASPDLIFELPPEDRLGAAMQKLGIRFSQLSDVAGHA